MASLYGLIGYPLSHSFSPAYFHHKFAKQGIDAIYQAYPILTINDFPALLNANPSLKGLNVTIPYKEQILHYLDEMDAAAETIGAVNCIKITSDRLIGYNTDHIGFADSLRPLLRKQHTHALVLGTGGAAKAVMYALHQLGIDCKTVSRTSGDITYDNLNDEIIQSHRLIINTTPLGMYPDANQCPSLPYKAIGQGHLLYDLIYNPEETLFLKQGSEAGAAIKNGYEMLILQAEASWQIWNTTR
ncbi:MAG: shikimate dehydrogenase [Flavipsychrobacter sp.]|nr:shikimate dehydrogenase [Flavipsychrobacter sp.]